MKNWFEHLKAFSITKSPAHFHLFFDSFYEMYFDEVFLIAVSRVSDEGEDIAQDFFLKIILNYDKLAQFPITSEAEFLSFFYKCAINHCNKAYSRKRRSQDRISLGLVCKATSAYQGSVEAAIDIANLLKILPKRQRIAIILFLEGFSAKEIAEKIGLGDNVKDKSNAIRNTIFRGKIKLRNYLKEEIKSTEQLYLLKCV